MCGYAGLVYTTKSTHSNHPNIQNAFIQAAERIAHRGNEPVKQVFESNVLLAHSRLAFQDLSSLSIQPMRSADNQWLLVFNGEIYNYQSLKKKIQAEFEYPFQSYGDTEIILAGFLCYKEKILDLLEGEYSFALFKADGTELFAARDPFGVKPLFVWCEGVQTRQFAIACKSYQFESSSFCVSSEIKGIFCKKEWNKEGFLRQATGLFEPICTPFENIIQVPQGSYLWAKKNNENVFNAHLVLNPKPFRASPFESYEDTSKIYKNFHEILQESVWERTISDVELGVYLSGGIDSKSVASYLSLLENTVNVSSRSLTAASIHSTKLKTFTVGFDVEEGFDETKDAINFAKAAGYDPYVCRVNYDDLSYAYPIAVYHSENIQPYTNGSAKWWLSRFASQHVKGVLTGDGADELLCGYPSFRYAAWWKFIFQNRPGENVFDQMKKLPLGTHWRDSVYSKRFQEHTKNPWLSGSSHVGSGIDFIESLSLWGVAHPLFGQIRAIAELFLGVEKAYEWLLAQRESVSSWFKFGFSEKDEFFTNPHNTLFLWQNYFCRTHLPVQVLNWVGDRMEMANTLEGRTPFLSKRLKNFIFHLGDNFFVRGFEEKSILKRNFKLQFPQFSKYLPAQKKQFNAPFLFDLKPKFHTDRILEKIKQYNLLESHVLEGSLFNNELYAETSPYSQSYLQAALQTLVSFTYVDDFVKEKKKLERNLEYENSKISANFKHEKPKILPASEHPHLA